MLFVLGQQGLGPFPLQQVSSCDLHVGYLHGGHTALPLLRSNSLDLTDFFFLGFVETRGVVCLLLNLLIFNVLN